jgi:glucose/arabinose dehydrogenase
MRSTLVLVLLLGCGKENAAKQDAATTPADASDAAVDATAATCEPISGTTVRIVDTKIRINNSGAMLLTSPPGDRRQFVVMKGGDIRIIENGELLATPFIDLGDIVSVSGESGLLGLAFHPQYAANGLFFVFYRRIQAGDNVNTSRDVVARCQRSADDPNKAEPACVEILAIPDFASNHNGGMIEFGSDGFLYVGTGDGGSGGDPNNNSQALVDNPSTNTVALLGKMLRLDVDNKAPGKEYGIPASNPFAAGGGAPEIYAYGLRNPWRWSFDAATGDMWIGDVGQGPSPQGIEEVEVVSPAELKGANFGWSTFHGSQCFKTPCDTNGKMFAKDERTAGEGWRAIIGGQVYRGNCYPDLVGTYFYADNVGNRYAKATLNADRTLTVTDLQPPPGDDPFPASPASIHADGSGELYVTTTAGGIFHIEATP